MPEAVFHTRWLSPEHSFSPELATLLCHFPLWRRQAHDPLQYAEHVHGHIHQHRSVGEAELTHSHEWGGEERKSRKASQKR